LNFQSVVRSKFIKILPMGSKLFHVEEQTNMTEVIVTCSKPDDDRKSRPHKLHYSEKKS